MQKNLLQHEAEADSLLILCLIVFRLSIRARSQHCGSFFVLSALTNPCCTLLQRTWCWYRLTSSCISKISSLHACPEYKGCRCQEPCCQGWLCFFCMPVGNPACHRAECWATALIKLRGQCYWFFSFSTLPRSPRQKRCSAKTPKPSELFLLESVWGQYWGNILVATQHSVQAPFVESCPANTWTTVWHDQDRSIGWRIHCWGNKNTMCSMD